MPGVPGRPLSHSAQVPPLAKAPMGICVITYTPADRCGCCDYYSLILLSVITYTSVCRVRCGSCDGQCGPGNGCPCTACVELSGYEIKAGKAVKVWGGRCTCV